MGQYFFSGIIDDIRIYDRALSETEIQELYHQGDWMLKPENLTISTANDIININWNSVIGATSYKVLSFDDPNSGFLTINH